MRGAVSNDRPYRDSQTNSTSNFFGLPVTAADGRVTRARMTQIMKLLDLAPDIQEQILFLPPVRGLNERNLRRVVSRIDWNEQRHLFHKIIGPGDSANSA